MEKYLYNLILHLRNRHNITLLISSRYNISIEGVKVLHYYELKIPFLYSISSIISLFILLPKILIQTKPKILSAFIPSYESLILFLFGKIFGIKNIINLRGIWEKTRIYSILSGTLNFLLTDAIIMNSKNIEEYSNAIWLPRTFIKKIQNYYIPNAINVEFWQPQKYENINKKYEITYVANIQSPIRISMKGLKTLYDSIKIIEEKYAKILQIQIIGKYDKKSIQNLIKKNIPDNFIFQGSISNKISIKEKIQQGKIFVLSSNIEGMPNSLMEAMSLAMPCISTDVGAVSELIEDNINGFIVPPKDPQSLAEKIWKLLNDIELQKKFSINSRKKMVEKFGWKKNTHTVEKYYQYILDFTEKLNKTQK